MESTVNFYLILIISPEKNMELYIKIIRWLPITNLLAKSAWWKWRATPLSVGSSMRVTIGWINMSLALMTALLFKTSYHWQLTWLKINHSLIYISQTTHLNSMHPGKMERRSLIYHAFRRNRPFSKLESNSLLWRPLARRTVLTTKVLFQQGQLNHNWSQS